MDKATTEQIVKEMARITTYIDVIKWSIGICGSICATIVVFGIKYFSSVADDYRKEVTRKFDQLFEFVGADMEKMSNRIEELNKQREQNAKGIIAMRHDINAMREECKLRHNGRRKKK